MLGFYLSCLEVFGERSLIIFVEGSEWNYFSCGFLFWTHTHSYPGLLHRCGRMCKIVKGITDELKKENDQFYVLQHRNHRFYCKRLYAWISCE